MPGRSRNKETLEIGLLARDIMSKDPVTVPLEMTVSQLVHSFHESQISGAPVTDAAGELVGVVSQSDIIRVKASVDDAMEDRSAFFNSLEAFAHLGDTPDEIYDELRVADICSSTVYTAHPETPVMELAEMLVKYQVHRVIVVEGSIPVGLVSSMDILNGIVSLRD